MILEPQLNVLRLQHWKALAVYRPIQFICELLDHVRRRMSVLSKPPLQARDLREGVDEHAAPLAPVARRPAVADPAIGRTQTLLERVHPRVHTRPATAPRRRIEVEGVGGRRGRDVAVVEVEGVRHGGLETYDVLVLLLPEVT